MCCVSQSLSVRVRQTLLKSNSLVFCAHSSSPVFCALPSEEWHRFQHKLSLKFCADIHYIYYKSVYNSCHIYIVWVDFNRTKLCSDSDSVRPIRPIVRSTGKVCVREDIHTPSHSTTTQSGSSIIKPLVFSEQEENSVWNWFFTDRKVSFGS